MNSKNIKNSPIYRKDVIVIYVLT